MSPAARGRIRVVVVGIVIVAAVLTLPDAGGAGATPGVAVAPAGSITFVSTRPACLRPLLGTFDYGSGSGRHKATETQTQTSFGWVAADLGYSFTFDRELWFLFGDSHATKDFPDGNPKFPNTENRFGTSSSSPYDANSYDNDSMGYTTQTAIGCPTLQAVQQPPMGATGPTVAAGAYTNPTLTYQGQSVSLRTDETPDAGVDVGGQMYVTFTTNNPNTNCDNCHGALGASYTSVMGRLDDPAPHPTNLDFTGLYTLSGPPPGTLSGPGSTSVPSSTKAAALRSPGVFTHNAIAAAPDGYIYIWGASGGGQNTSKTGCTHGLTQCGRRSAVYLARIPSSLIATANDGRPAAIQYYDGTSFAPAGSAESVATPLFSDTPHPCVGELGVEYDPAIADWVMLYNCSDRAPGHPPGIWMRTAPQPWGPWSEPHTIDTGNGPYAPYLVPGWITGTAATATARATSTFYYTVSSFKPYGVSIMRTTVEYGTPVLPPKPGKPGCTGTKCN